MTKERCKVLMEKSEKIEEIVSARYDICVEIDRGLCDIYHSDEVKRFGHFWSMTKVLPSGLFKYKIDGPHTMVWYKGDLVLKLRSYHPKIFYFDEEWYDLLIKEIADIKYYDECLALAKKMDKYGISDSDIGVGV